MRVARVLLFVSVALFFIPLGVKGWAFSKITGVMLAAVALLILGDRRYRRRLDDRNLIPLILMISAGVMGTILFGVETSLTKMFLNLVLYVSVVVVADRLSDLRLLLWAAVTGGMIVVVTGLTEIYGGGSVYRVTGVYENANGYGQACAAVAICAVGLTVLKPRRVVRHLLLVFIILSLVGVLQSGSRAAFGGLLGGLLAFSLVGLVRRAAVVTMLLLAVILSFAAPEEFVDRWKHVVQPTRAGRQSSLEERLDLTRIGWVIFKKYPVVGVGPGNTGEVMRGVHVNLVTHNTYIQTLAETGIVGGLGFGFLIVTASFRFYRLMRSRLLKKDDRVIAGTYFAWLGFSLIFGLSHGTYLHSEWYVFFAVGAVLVRQQCWEVRKPWDVSANLRLGYTTPRFPVTPVKDEA